jgi:hypothetical protein
MAPFAVIAPQIFPTPQLTQTFYDVTAVVTALVNLGLTLELPARVRTSEAIKKLIGLQAKTARDIHNGVEVDLPFGEVLALESALRKTKMVGVVSFDYFHYFWNENGTIAELQWNTSW